MLRLTTKQNAEYSAIDNPNGFEKTEVGGQKNKLRSNSTNVHSKNECSTCG